MAEGKREFCRNLFKLLDMTVGTFFMLAVTVEIEFFEWYRSNLQKDKLLEVAEEILNLLCKRIERIEQSKLDSIQDRMIDQVLSEQITNWLNNLENQLFISEKIRDDCAKMVIILSRK